MTILAEEAGQYLAHLWTCVILDYWQLQKQNVNSWMLNMMSMLLLMPVELHFAAQLL